MSWLRLHRRCLEHRFYAEPRVFSRWEAWEYLLLKANWKDGKAMYHGKIKHVPRGSFITSILQLSHAWRWSQGKVKRFFSLLSEEEMVRIERLENGHVIHIANYAKYQDMPLSIDEPAESGRRADGERTETIEQRNKGIRSRKDPTDPEVRTNQKVSTSTQVQRVAVFDGCTHFRITETELLAVEKRYEKLRLSAELIPLAIAEVDGWLSEDTPAARKARDTPTHFRRLTAAWVIENITKIDRARNGSGSARHPPKPHGQFQNSRERSNEVLRKAEEAAHDQLRDSEIADVFGECDGTKRH